MVKKNKYFFFLSLVLFILIFPSVVSAKNIIVEENPQEMLLSDGISWRANSDLPIDGTYLFKKPEWYEFWLAGKRPSRCRIYIENNVGENVYVMDDASDAWGETGEYYYVVLRDKGLKIPCFPGHGPWKVKIIWYNDVWGYLENKFSEIHYIFNVGESGWLDNLVAPIYIFWDSIPLFQKDDVGIALPGILYLSMFIWIPVLVIAIIIYFRLSAKIGLKLARKKNKKEA